MEDARMEEEQGPIGGEPMRNGESSGGFVETSSGVPDLPEACIATILSCLPPREVAKAAYVCQSYHLASQSDLVWASLLPPGHMDMLELITDPKPVFKSKKDIYNYLTTPKFFAEGTKAYWIDRETGGVILSISARGLCIIWGSTPQYWNWIPNEHSLFPEVAHLKNVCWFEVSGAFEVALPPGSYTLSWRIQLVRPNNFSDYPVHFTFSKNDLDVSKCMCYFDPRPEVALRATGNEKLPTIRVLGNRWQEYDVAEFSVDRDEPSCMLKVHLISTQGGMWKSGISMDGIVIRPTNTIKNLQRGSSMAGPSIGRAPRSVEGARMQFPDILQKFFSALRNLS